MKKKKVYLFELDSVRKTDEEILYGQQCLYNEIVNNGNIVVMTFNQFVDSRAFFSLLDDKEYRENIISLFEKGVLRISQYKDIRTINQYLINSVDPEKKFIYSALPIKYTQKNLMALLKRELVNSDLSELYEYFDEIDEKGRKTHEGKLKPDLINLFKEYDEDGYEIESNKNENRLQDICRRLYHLLQVCFTISPKHEIYTYAKMLDDYEDYDFLYYINILIKGKNKIKLDDKFDKKEFIKALNMLDRFINDNKTNNRSVILRKIKEEYDSTKLKISKLPYQYAEIIVNLCQNYASEASIRNISKHYNFSNNDNKNIDKDTFYLDFANKFKEAWNIGESETDRKYLTDESNEFVAYNPYRKIFGYKIKNKEFPDFSACVRYVEYQGYTFNETLEEDDSQLISRYEFKLKSQVINQLLDILKKIFISTVISLFWLAIAYYLDDKLSSLKDQIFGGLQHITFIKEILATLFTEAISRVVTLIIKDAQSFSDALANIIKYVWDFIVLLIKSIINITKVKKLPTNQDYDFKEEFNKTSGVTVAYSPEMNKYLKLKKDNKALFANKSKYPKFADCSNIEIEKQIIEYENIHNQKFGVIYKGPYNELIVDPVIFKGNVLGAYDRLITTRGGSGAVIIVKEKDKFLLVKQFRHAFRKEMLNFPRGFSEKDDKDPKVTALRELAEEIGIDITKINNTKIKQIGQISPDSGLTNKLVNVFYAEVNKNDYKKQKIDLEITDIVACNEKQLEKMIRSGELVDGFSLCAYLLYKQAKVSGKL